jgi:hypothetical protein
LQRVQLRGFASSLLHAAPMLLALPSGEFSGLVRSVAAGSVDHNRSADDRSFNRAFTKCYAPLLRPNSKPT